jgi:hypothetical protein
MTSLLLLFMLVAQAAPSQEPSEVRSGVNEGRLRIPIKVTIEGADSLPGTAGAQIPMIRLVPANDGKSIETALNSKDLSLTLELGTLEKNRVEK